MTFANNPTFFVEYHQKTVSVPTAYVRQDYLRQAAEIAPMTVASLEMSDEPQKKWEKITK